MTTNPPEGAQSPRVSKPLGQRLLDAGLLTEAQLDLGLREQRRSSGFLGSVLVGLGFVTDEDITAVLADENDVDMVSLKDVEISSEVLDLISYETARRHKVVPLRKEVEALVVAFADSMDVVAQDVVERESHHPIIVVTAPQAQVLETIERAFLRTSSINDAIEQVLAGDIVGCR